MTMKEIRGGVCAPEGFLASSIHAGIRKAHRDDLTLIVSEEDAVAAGVFTTNRVHAWCVAHNRMRLQSGQAQAIVCNAGNANACNGEHGCSDDERLAAEISKLLGERYGSRTGKVLTASTGVIGKKLPIERAVECMPLLVKSLERSDESGTRAAQAIMTTDLVPKSVAVECTMGAKKFRIGGIAKGSGMIAPNMATMLAFITTDAAIDGVLLDKILRRVVTRTFNRMTVDGDTSTNDMALILANRRSGVTVSEDAAVFEQGLIYVCETLAKKIARDGEGATKLVTVRLKNPPTGGERIARTIAESPLVKTACFGCDPNWGRIMMAAGRAGVDFNPNEVIVNLAGHEVFRGGEPTSFNPDVVSRAMKSEDLLIELEFLGTSKSDTVEMWTCDLSYDYVKINADYGT